MKAKTLAVFSTAALLSMSVAAHTEECNKESGPWFTAGNGKACLPYGFSLPYFGTVSVGETNVYAAAGFIGVIGCAMNRPWACKVVKFWK
jgi:hypothetical protein